MPATNLCPYCGEPMAVSRMTCHHCHVSVDAAFPAPRLASLPSEQQRFIELFVMAGGNLKQLAEQAGVSYPTVRSRLDKVIDSLRLVIESRRAEQGRSADAATDAMASADEAAQIIKSV